MNALTFDAPEFAPLSLLALVVLPIGVWSLLRRRQVAHRMIDSACRQTVLPPISLLRGALRVACISLGLLLAVVALMGPRWGTHTTEVIRRDLDVLVILDVSRSMLAEDLAPNRLQRAKFAIANDLVPALGGDRIGLLTFAGLPSLRCPLTTDYGFFRLALDDVTTDSAPRGGTAIGDALRASAAVFESPLDSQKLVILITDGEDHETYPVEAARGLWEDHQIPIIALALGDPEQGARIPASTDEAGQFLERAGEPVRTRARFAELATIAQLSSLHAFVPVGTRDFDLGAIYQRVIATMDYDLRGSAEAHDRVARHQLFSAAALLVLFIAAVLSDYKRTARDMNESVA